MKLRSLRMESEPQLMIIPMIDIIFFLLVFFMMSTLYMVEQNTIPVNLPQATAHRMEETRQIAVTVTSEGRILFDKEELPLALVRRRAQAELGKQNDAVFVLRSDKQTEYGKVVAVLDELKLAGVQRLAIATEKKAGQ